MLKAKSFNIKTWALQLAVRNSSCQFPGTPSSFHYLVRGYNPHMRNGATISLRTDLPLYDFPSLNDCKQIVFVIWHLIRVISVPTFFCPFPSIFFFLVVFVFADRSQRFFPVFLAVVLWDGWLALLLALIKFIAIFMKLFSLNSAFSWERTGGFSSPREIFDPAGHPFAILAILAINSRTQGGCPLRTALNIFCGFLRISLAPLPLGPPHRTTPSGHFFFWTGKCYKNKK